eukprot:TRINITY_DN1376_c1_g1_i4.p1 TRINITY_DN1376_c1_g1~~TRINITY_DN1376_c1_g1_i4.p1  ORF type:complete len:963 (-),score=108.30 TRINITY_DN1376_c1_g1_i4:367-3255(-)
MVDKQQQKDKEEAAEVISHHLQTMIRLLSSSQSYQPALNQVVRQFQRLQQRYGEFVPYFVCVKLLQLVVNWQHQQGGENEEIVMHAYKFEKLIQIDSFDRLFNYNISPNSFRFLILKMGWMGQLVRCLDACFSRLGQLRAVCENMSIVNKEQNLQQTSRCSNAGISSSKCDVNYQYQFYFQLLKYALLQNNLKHVTVEAILKILDFSKLNFKNNLDENEDSDIQQVETWQQNEDQLDKENQEQINIEIIFLKSYLQSNGQNGEILNAAQQYLSRIFPLINYQYFCESDIVALEVEELFDLTTGCQFNFISILQLINFLMTSQKQKVALNSNLKSYLSNFLQQLSNQGGNQFVIEILYNIVNNSKATEEEDFAFALQQLQSPQDINFLGLSGIIFGIQNYQKFQPRKIHLSDNERILLIILFLLQSACLSKQEVKILLVEILQRFKFINFREEASWKWLQQQFNNLSLNIQQNEQVYEIFREFVGKELRSLLNKIGSSHFTKNFYQVGSMLNSLIAIEPFYATKVVCKEILINLKFQKASKACVQVLWCSLQECRELILSSEALEKAVGDALFKGTEFKEVAGDFLAAVEKGGKDGLGMEIDQFCKVVVNAGLSQRNYGLINKVLSPVLYNYNTTKIKSKEVESITGFALASLEHSDAVVYDEILFEIIVEITEFLSRCRFTKVTTILKENIEQFCNQCSCEALGHALFLADTLSLQITGIQNQNLKVELEVEALLAIMKICSTCQEAREQLRLIILCNLSKDVNYNEEQGSALKVVLVKLIRVVVGRELSDVDSVVVQSLNMLIHIEENQLKQIVCNIVPVILLSQTNNQQIEKHHLISANSGIFVRTVRVLLRVIILNPTDEKMIKVFQDVVKQSSTFSLAEGMLVFDEILSLQYSTRNLPCEEFVEVIKSLVSKMVPHRKLFLGIDVEQWMRNKVQSSFLKQESQQEVLSHINDLLQVSD